MVLTGWSGMAPLNVHSSDTQRIEFLGQRFRSSILSPNPYPALRNESIYRTDSSPPQNTKRRPSSENRRLPHPAPPTHHFCARPPPHSARVQAPEAPYTRNTPGDARARRKDDRDREAEAGATAKADSDSGIAIGKGTGVLLRCNTTEPRESASTFSGPRLASSLGPSHSFGLMSLAGIHPDHPRCHWEMDPGSGYGKLLSRQRLPVRGELAGVCRGLGG